MPCAVVLTALPVEYLAVRKFLTNLREVVNSQGTVYEQGVFAGEGFAWEVGIAEVGAGNAGAAIEAERAIGHFKPDVLLFVGIAGGLKDDVAIGDVVAATKVYGYESGKVASEGFLTRPALGHSAFALVQRARAEARKEDWLGRGEIVGKPKVVVGAIAAGDKVLADTGSELFKLLRSAYNDAIAVEMEGFGFLSAVFAYPSIQAIVVRGISDMVAGKNDDGGQGKEVDRHVWAANHASAFAFELLAKFQSNEELNPVSSEKIVGGNINISGSVQDSVVITGNSNVINYVFKNSLGQEKEIRMPDAKTIRQLIESALSSEDLSNLCQDDFPQVFKLFGENQSTGQRVRWLVQHVEKQHEIPKLLNAIKDLNPVEHARFLSS
jgi:nucleoside phosphorylase